MKSKDLTLILVVGIISAVFAVLLSKVLIGSDQSRQLKAEVVEPISDQFTPPDRKYFNDNSIDPTQEIRIGDGATDDPFRKTAQ